MSTLTRWSEIVSLFTVVLDLPSDQQESYLERVCGGDIELNAAVLTLLRVNSALGDSLPVGEPLDSELGRSVWSLPPLRKLGPYRLVRLIGRGGMGLVYLAEREEDYSRMVAIKLMAPMFKGSTATNRFFREREILSKLEHQNIARLYGGGIDPELGLYFAMEYVEGVPITTYCQRNGLAVPERLRLFLAVCEAVAFAHKRLVVHRDLKPQNILVTVDAHVKLLDFGIAKLLEADDDLQGTRLTARAMTPAYASPEQVRGESLGTSSDIYSLGVVLYEILTGGRPIDINGSEASDSWSALERWVPQNPSSVVSRKSDEIATVRDLRGDVDRIVLKCLASVPDERYDSVDSLAEDIKLHLMGRPIRARSRRFRYVSQKYMARNRTTLIVGVVLIAVSVASLVFSISARLSFREEKLVARGLTSYLTSLFELANPAVRSDTSITYEEILKAGWEEAKMRLNGKGERYAAVTTRIAELYTEIGRFDTAARIHQDVLNDMGDEPSLLRVANLAGLGLALQELGRFQEARGKLREALQLQLRLPAYPDSSAARILLLSASLEFEMGNLPRADSLAELAYKVRRKSKLASQRGLADILHQMAAIARARDDLGRAEDLLEEAFDLTGHTDDRPSLVYADLLESLGLVYTGQGRYEEAALVLERCLELRKERLGATHPSVGVVLLNLAEAAWFARGRRVADSLAQMALQNLVNSKGEKHPDVSTVLNDIGLRSRRIGDYSAAESLYVRSIQIGSESLGRLHPDVAGTWNSLAVVLRLQGKLEQARDAYQTAAKGYLSNAPTMDLSLSRALNGLGRVQLDLGEVDDAVESFRGSLKIRQRLLEDGHWRLGTAHSYYGHALGVKGLSQEAELHLLKGVEILDASLGPNSDKTFEAQQRLEDFKRITKKSSSVDNGDVKGSELVAR